MAFVHHNYIGTMPSCANCGLLCINGPIWVGSKVRAQRPLLASTLARKLLVPILQTQPKNTSIEEKLES